MKLYNFVTIFFFLVTPFSLYCMDPSEYPDLEQFRRQDLLAQEALDLGDPSDSDDSDVPDDNNDLPDLPDLHPVISDDEIKRLMVGHGEKTGDPKYDSKIKSVRGVCISRSSDIYTDDFGKRVRCSIS